MVVGIINACNYKQVTPENTLNQFLLSPNGRVPLPAIIFFGGRLDQHRTEFSNLPKRGSPPPSRSRPHAFASRTSPAGLATPGEIFLHEL
jgi:hypothetical protein